MILKLVKELVDKFLRVSLLTRIGRLSVPLLEREAELGRIDGCSLSHVEVAVEGLQLAQHVVIYLTIFILFYFGCTAIDYLQKTVAEGWNHEELLQHGDHVAHITKVFYSYLFIGTANPVRWLMAPGVGTRDTFNHRLEHVFEEVYHISRSQVLEHLEQELVRGLSSLSSLCLVAILTLCLIMHEEDYLVKDVLDQIL